MPECQLWIGVVRVKPISPGTWKGAAGAYTNIVTWATSSEEFREKAEKLAASMKLFIADIEAEQPVSERIKQSSLSKDLEEIVSRAESNPNAIMYGTFHEYPFEDA
jgi:hypothetical protein